MNTKLLFSGVYAIVAYMLVRNGVTIFMPAMLAGAIIGLTINTRPHLRYAKTGAIAAAVFALAFGVIMGFIDREPYQNTWGSFVMFSILSFILTVPGLLATCLIKEISTYLRECLR